MKHTPATPLPWEYEATIGDMSGWIAAARAEGGVAARPEPHKMKAISERKNATRVCVLDERSQQDAAYIAHAANAYPKLVRALSELVAFSPNQPTCDAARALLRSLGEGA